MMSNRVKRDIEWKTLEDTPKIHRGLWVQSFLYLPF